MGNSERFSEGIAWGITGDHEMVLFVVDSRNPFTIRSNAMMISHELLHAIYIDNIGTFHIKRFYDAPDGDEGTRAPAGTVIVHDNWYGSRKTFRFWISYVFGWLPITISYIPITSFIILYKFIYCKFQSILLSLKYDLSLLFLHLLFLNLN